MLYVMTPCLFLGFCLVFNFWISIPVAMCLPFNTLKIHTFMGKIALFSYVLLENE